MRKELKGYNIYILERVLEDLGYKGGSYHTGFPSAFDEWRKDGFHITLREKPDRVVLTIHHDPRYHIGPVRTRGRDLEEEVREIIKAYKSSH